MPIDSIVGCLLIEYNWILTDERAMPADLYLFGPQSCTLGSAALVSTPANRIVVLKYHKKQDSSSPR